MTSVLAYDHLLACAKAVQPLVDEITSAPVRVRELQTELDRLSTEVTSTQQTLSSDRTAFAEERRKWKAEGDRTSDSQRLQLEEMAAQLSEAEGRVRAMQAQTATVTKRLEALAALFRKYDRMVAAPSAGAAGLAGVVAEMKELVRP